MRARDPPEPGSNVAERAAVRSGTRLLEHDFRRLSRRLQLLHQSLPQGALRRAHVARRGPPGALRGEAGGTGRTCFPWSGPGREASRGLSATVRRKMLVKKQTPRRETRGRRAFRGRHATRGQGPSRAPPPRACPPVGLTPSLVLASSARMPLSAKLMAHPFSLAPKAGPLLSPNQALLAQGVKLAMAHSSSEREALVHGGNCLRGRPGPAREAVWLARGSGRGAARPSVPERGACSGARGQWGGPGEGRGAGCPRGVLGGAGRPHSRTPSPPAAS